MVFVIKTMISSKTLTVPWAAMKLQDAWCETWLSAFSRRIDYPTNWQTLNAPRVTSPSPFEPSDKKTESVPRQDAKKYPVKTTE